MHKKIRLATGHAHAFHRASAIAAISSGYFRDEGLPEVDLQASGECSLTVQGLKAGTIDFGLDVGPRWFLQENSNGEELYIVGGMLNWLPSTLIGTGGIRSLADLRGKKIGIIEKGSGRDVAWIRMLLRKAGLDPDRDVAWVTGAGYGSLAIQGPRLDRGDYQAVCLSGHNKRPELFDLVRQAGYVHLAERSETYPDGIPDRVVITTGGMLREHPEIVKAVLKGIVRGYRFARDPRNGEKLREMYLAHNWGKDGFGWGRFDESLLNGMVESSRILPTDGRVSISGLDALIDEEKASGKLPGDFIKERVLRLVPLQEAVSELNAQFGLEGYA